jgi:hypothetical protein
LGKALGRDSKGGGKGGEPKPERDAGITVGPREPELDDPAGKKDEAKGKPGQGVAGDEGSLSSARRAAKETEGGAAGARGDTAPAGREADVRSDERQGGGSATPRSESQSTMGDPAVQELVGQVTERPVTERGTLAEDLAAFQASLESQAERDGKKNSSA